MFPSPAQVARAYEVLESGTQGALAVRQHLGQRLHGDVRTFREPVHVRGDGGFPRGKVPEVIVAARQLAGRRTFSVARTGHGVRVCVRGGGRGTKVAVSHQINFLE